MRLRHRLCLVPVAIAVVLAGGSTARAAPPSVVNFDELAPDTRVIDQYAASQNIVFGSPTTYVQGFIPPARCGTTAADALVVTDAAGARGGSVQCSGTEQGGVFETAMHTDLERRGVSFTLRGAGLDANEAVVKAYNAGTVGGPPSLISSQSVTVAGNAPVPVSLAHTGADGFGDIATVVITASGGKISDLVIDDISMPRDDVPPPPKFSMSLDQPTVDVVEGGSVDAPINVQRYNGSTGAVTFDVAGPLPSGLTAAQVTPNPVLGTNPPALRIAAALPFAGDRQIGVSATGAPSAGTFIGGGRIQSVHGVPAILAGDGGVVRPGAQVSIVTGCGDKPAEYPVTVRGGFSGFVDLTVERTDGAVDVERGSVRLRAAGDGTLVFPYGLRQPLGTHGDSTLDPALPAAERDAGRRHGPRVRERLRDPEHERRLLAIHRLRVRVRLRSLVQLRRAQRRRGAQGPVPDRLQPELPRRPRPGGRRSSRTSRTPPAGRTPTGSGSRTRRGRRRSARWDRTTPCSRPAPRSRCWATATTRRSARRTPEPTRARRPTRGRTSCTTSAPTTQTSARRSSATATRSP